ncbi:MAG: 4Fe-4S dicluster domain-containing protein [Candidatus Omnitrophica bacterium]|nr:4Fe-4S dicluster domain-containing protein [Candidatus Omnitrophota bacterium]MBD3269576.1 4Fe-4S dicluster domain-containing protein [Candidatus Omnitrophota bacterium]
MERENRLINSAEQVHQGKLNTEPRKASDKRLCIDLDKCSSGECKECVIQCSYLFRRQVPDNNGIISVAELATYALVCRRCEEPHCVNACPVEALEQQKDKDKMLIRHNMRCISCKSCSHACPYGTIYPENVPLLIHCCDFCLDRRDKEGEPLCIKTCPYGALSLKKGDCGLDENTFLVGDNLIVHSTHWQRERA